MSSVAPDSGPKSGTGQKKNSASGGGGVVGGTGLAAGPQPPEQAHNCPRCNSPNTKFCYYNNYSLAQPRHFCKSCRRYWTKGGALRNVPVGGGSRKNKKNRSSLSASSLSQSSSTLFSLNPLDAIVGNSEATSAAAGLKFLTHTAIDFHLGFVPFSRIQHPAGSQFTSSTCFSPSGSTSNATASLAGFNYPIGASSSNGSSCSNYSGIVSSIESLSSINQNLHWRLQQQRLAMFIEGDAQNGSTVPAIENQVVEPNSFCVEESNKGEIFWDNDDANGARKASDTGTAWFLDGSFSMPASATSNDAIANASNVVTEWNGITAWNDVQQFTALP